MPGLCVVESASNGAHFPQKIAATRPLVARSAAFFLEKREKRETREISERRENSSLKYFRVFR
jgi:hypothetical protein